MGLRKPSRVQTLFAQAASGTQQQEEARQKLKKPEALGGSASMGTGMVASTTAAQQGATKKVGETSTEMAANVSGSKITAPTATANTYTTPSTVATTASTVKSNADQVVAPSNAPPIPTQQIDQLNANAASITQSISDIDKEIENIKNSGSVTAAADIKALLDQKNKLMEQWNTYNDLISKGNLGQIAGPSTFETQMEANQQTLAARGGGNVGKLQAAFGSRWAPTSTEAKALASQMYGKDLEAIQEQAAAGISEQDQAKREKIAATEAYKSQLDTSKKSVEDKVESETNKIDALKNGWEVLKKQGETLETLSKLFGSAEEAKKYFSFDDKGNLTGDRRTEKLSQLTSTAGALKTELKKTQDAATKINEEQFNNLANSLISKDAYGNLTGGTLKAVQAEINEGAGVSNAEIKGIADKYLTNLATVEAEINNAIASKDAKRVNDARNKLNTLRDEYMNELKNFGTAIPMNSLGTKTWPNYTAMVSNKIYKLPDGTRVMKQTPIGVRGPGSEQIIVVDMYGRPTGKTLPKYDQFGNVR